MTDNPWKSMEEEMSEVQVEVRRLFEIVMGRNLGHLLISRGYYNWQPAIDVYETDSEVIVKADVAGVAVSEMEITIVDSILTLSGRRENEPEVKKTAYHQMGISYGEFQAEVNIPVPVECDKTTARCVDGFLFVKLPKAEPKHQPTQIKVIVLTGEESSR